MTHYGPSVFFDEMCLARLFISPAPTDGAFSCMDWEGSCVRVCIDG
jgi:hypothetical protein